MFPSSPRDRPRLPEAGARSSCPCKGCRNGNAAGCGHIGVSVARRTAMADQPKKMNVVQLTFIVTVNMMGSGIIMLPSNMAKVGAISLLSWIVTAIGSLAIAYGFAQAGLFNQRPGGMAAYAEDAYGKSGYFLVFFLYFLSLAIGNVAIAISALGYLAAFAPFLKSTPIITALGVIALLWLTTVA